MRLIRLCQLPAAVLLPVAILTFLPTGRLPSASRHLLLRVSARLGARWLLFPRCGSPRSVAVRPARWSCSFHLSPASSRQAATGIKSLVTSTFDGQQSLDTNRGPGARWMEPVGWAQNRPIPQPRLLPRSGCGLDLDGQRPRLLRLAAEGSRAWADSLGASPGRGSLLASSFTY